ncbi:MAG: hypothetical protein A2Z88_02590 [Omnitrophica WOR_2 bacterium GWA2_47_8]|nr:MAG: hypothetical protein A2Z88_02590 [Omnitrophica WOR_2 bacterium GWA2_47_8]
MFVMGNFIIAVAKVIGLLLNLAWWLILARALISWVSPDPFNPIVQFLHRVTEPMLEPIRRFLPHSVVDISPIIAWLIISFLQWFLVPTLIQFGMQFQ